MMFERRFAADRGDDGRRLDLVVLRHVAHVSGVSRTRVQRWIAEGLITLGPRRAKDAAQRVHTGDLIGLLLEEPAPRPMPAPPRVSLSILFEDDELLVINKPAGLVVHPTFRHTEGTLLDALLHYAGGWPVGRPSLVQRLDKNTSGLLLVAKSAATHAALVNALRRHDARKEYLALCYGRMTAASRRLRYPLGPDPLDRRRRVVREDGAEATTDVVRLAMSRDEMRGITLVACRLITGRTHQIRAHLLAAGLPIVGDPVYGSDGWSRVRDLGLRMQLQAFGRQALHAWRLSFAHPRTGARVDVEAPIPADLDAVMRRAQLQGDALAARR